MKFNVQFLTYKLEDMFNLALSPTTVLMSKNSNLKFKFVQIILMEK